MIAGADTAQRGPAADAGGGGAPVAAEVQGPAIHRPARPGAALGRDLHPRAASGDRPDEHIPSPCFVGHVGHPPSIGRDARMRFVEQRSHERSTFARGDVHDPHVGASHRVELGEREQPAVRRPRRGQLVPRAFEERRRRRIGVSGTQEQIEGAGLGVRERNLEPIGPPRRAGAAPVGEDPAHRASTEIADPQIGASVGLDRHRELSQIRRDIDHVEPGGRERDRLEPAADVEPMQLLVHVGGRARHVEQRPGRREGKPRAREGRTARGEAAKNRARRGSHAAIAQRERRRLETAAALEDEMARG